METATNILDIFLLDITLAFEYHTCMPYNKPPHLLFRKILEILDDMRRDSIKAIKEADKKKMFGLTVRQGSAISQLRLMLEENPEGVSLKSLAQRMQMTVPATSLLVETMVSKGFMMREANPTDRRAVCIKLTTKGEDIFNNVYYQFHEEVDRRAKALTQEELDAFASIVDKMQG